MKKILSSKKSQKNLNIQIVNPAFACDVDPTAPTSPGSGSPASGATTDAPTTPAKPFMVTEPVNPSTAQPAPPPAEEPVTPPTAEPPITANNPLQSTTPTPEENPNLPEEPTPPSSGFVVSASSPISDTQTQPTATTAPKKSPLNKVAILSAIVFVLITTPLAMYLGQRSQDNRQKAAALLTSPEAIDFTTKPQKAISQQNLDMAKQVMSWIDKQKSETGAYYPTQINIGQPNAQTTKETDIRVGLYALWARFVYWQNTQDASNKLLENLKQDVDNYNDPKKVNTLQPDFYSCRILYDLELDTTLPKEFKKDVQNICDRVSMVMPDFTEFSKTGKIPQYTEVNLSQIFTQKPLGIVPKEKAKILINFVPYSAYISDLVAKQWWTKDAKYLDMAKAIFNKTVEYYTQLRTQQSVPEACILGNSALDLYQSTKDNKYLNFAVNLAASKKFDQGSLFAQANCVIFLDNLITQANQIQYTKTKKDLTNQLIKNNYDSKGGAFFSMEGENKIYNVKDNALMIKVLTLE